MVIFGRRSDVRMKNNAKKMTRLIEKYDRLFFQSIETHPRKGKKNEKKYENKLQKKLDRAEEIIRRALTLCRDDIANGLSNGGETLIHCIYRLSDLLILRGRKEEAVPLLAEICENRKDYEHTLLLTPCLGHYGSILCENGSYDQAAAVLSQMLVRVKNEISRGVYPEGMVPDDVRAVCSGLGNAACAFTYSDTGEGFAPDQFTNPVDLLEKIAKHGEEISADNIKKAAYYAASQQLFITCYDNVPGADVSHVVEYAEKCVNACGKNGKYDLFFPAAMRLTALALARDCRFADAAEMCSLTLDECAEYRGNVTRADFGSIQSFTGDMNLLLGILHYRTSKISDCIRYFEAAIASYEADAKGVPLRKVGYAEAETEILYMTNSEKCAFACKYIGLAKFSENERYSLDECAGIMRRGIELLESTDPEEPYFILAASAEYHILSQMCERAGDKDSAKKYDELSKNCGIDALNDLQERLADKNGFAKYLESVQIRRRIALRLGLLELYGDYTRFEMLLSEPPYSLPDHRHLARLNFDMGEYSRVLGKNESAVGYYEDVRTHSFDSDGKPYYEMGEGNIFEFSLVASASCLTKCGQMARARRIFREFADMHKGDEGIAGKTMLVKIAGLSREVGLDPAECAGYMNAAAHAVESEDDSSPVAAELYNQEGICWYNASPTDVPSQHDELNDKEKARLEEQFADRELHAFENALRVLNKCDPDNEKAIDLMPSLHSNIGECYMRREDYAHAIKHYHFAVEAFERLFASGKFSGKAKPAQEPYIFQYGLCFKALGDIYNELDDNRKCAEALTKAILVMERLDNPAARNELAACLNARGVVNFRLGNYKKNIEDATRAIALKKDDDGGEINMAIMLKNRSDAYRELGDFKSMQSDLSESINLLDKSELPDELLGSFYSSHWFSMGVCQEGLNKNGKAADAYRRAAGYMEKSGNSEDSGIYMKALCHFRRAVCLCRREEQEYYGALYEYNKAIKLLENMPASTEKNENLRQLLSSRGSLYEAFREIDLAKADFTRAESLRAVKDISGN